MEVRGRDLHFGVQLGAQDTTWAGYARALTMVEELGFNSVWTFDHLLAGSEAGDRPCFETMTTISAMALITTSVRFGVLVNGVPYRNPAVLAKAAAQVDHMSDGRLDFSLGAGWAEKEFKAYGLDFPPLAERYDRLDEALQVVKLLWGQRRSTFHGRYYQLEDAPCEPKPLQAPHPPIMIGGTGARTLRIAATHADRINLSGSPERCAERIEKLRGICAETGRDFEGIELSLHPNMALAPTLEEAEALARRIAANHSVDLDSSRGSWLIGNPTVLAHQLHRYIGLGINHFVIAVGPPFDVGPLKLFQEEVVPALVN